MRVPNDIICKASADESTFIHVHSDRCPLADYDSSNDMLNILCGPSWPASDAGSGIEDKVTDPRRYL